MNKIKHSIQYAEFLETINFNRYCTLTTRYSQSMPSARKTMVRYHNIIKDNFPQAQMFWVAEPHDTKYGYHTHALISLSDSEVSNTDMELNRAWQIATNGKGGKGFNKTNIQPYIKDKGANYYVSKYMLRNNADYDFFI